MMKVREFAGAINRCDAVLVPVHYGPGDDDWEWIPIGKRDARTITEAAKESGLEEIDAVLIDDEEGNNLYIEYGDDEGEEEEPAETPAEAK